MVMRVSFASFLVGVVVVAAIITAAVAQFGVYTKTEVDKGQWDESATADKVRAAAVKTKSVKLTKITFYVLILLLRPSHF